MKSLNIPLLAACLAGFTFAAVSPGSAQPPVTLTSGGSSAVVDLGSSAGMSSWTISGVNQLRQQWFWYKYDGVQQSIDQLGYLSSSSLGANNVSVNYGNVASPLRINIDYTLAWVGDNTADMTESIVLHNTSASDITVSFFQYSDFNLGGIAGGDQLDIAGTPYNGSPGSGFYVASQIKSENEISETIVLPYAHHTEASSDPLALRGKLDGGIALNDCISASGDVAWAYQWDLIIAANSDSPIIKDKYLYVVPVPEPGALSLLGLSWAVLALRRRAQN
jgi:hypothetical protein